MQRLIGTPLECHILLILKYIMYFYINIIRSSHFLQCRKDWKALSSLWVLRISQSFWFLNSVYEVQLCMVNFIKYLIHIFAYISFQFVVGRLVVDYRVLLRIQLLVRLIESQKKVPFEGI